MRGRASRRWTVATAAVVVATLWSASAAGAGGQLALPDLVPDAPRDLHIASADRGSGGFIALRFTLRTRNDGPVALDVLAARPADASLATVAEQCTGFVGRVCAQRQEIGTFAFHAQHGHWHFTDYALYELRAVNPDGTPDMTDDGLVVDGGKASFCLLDSNRQDPDASGPNYIGCPAVYQGISAGWADEYTADIPGQQVVLDGVPDGIYALVVTVDPEGRLLEMSHDNNAAYTIFERDGSRVHILSTGP